MKHSTITNINFQVDNNKCVMVGGYSQSAGSKHDEACDKMIEVILDRSGLISDKVIGLNSGPVAQPCILHTPNQNVFIVAGGIQETWALLSETTAPSAPCALSLINRCLLISDPEENYMDTVKWIGCDGPCKRWFHSPCLHFSDKDYSEAIKCKKWFCNQSDCK